MNEINFEPYHLLSIIPIEQNDYIFFLENESNQKAVLPNTKTNFGNKKTHRGGISKSELNYFWKIRKIPIAE